MKTETLTSNPTSPIIDLNDSAILLLEESPSRCRVLVVEDDQSVRNHLAALLHLGGYEVHTAASGEEALRILATTFCQMVLTDWHMPDMDGLALCRNLRLSKSDGYIYILMLTVRDGRRDILAGLSAGADDYVVKGATSEEILARLEVGRRITHLERSLRNSNRENRRMSETDPLTGARNRRFLMKYLPRELERSQRHGYPLAILSCDIDHFKRINDGFGHQAGDEILQAFVARSGTCIREEIDWIVRSGGEEFVFVLPETNLTRASKVAETLRDALLAQPISTSAGPLTVTISIGVTALETAQELRAVSSAELLRAADRCLYASKNLGRDRATAASVGRASAVLSGALPGVKSEIN
jgi:two-component system cell cycle response regulator